MPEPSISQKIQIMRKQQTHVPTHCSLSLWFSGGSPAFRLPAHNLSFLNVVIPFAKLAFFLSKTIHSPLCHSFSPASWSFLFFFLSQVFLWSFLSLSGFVQLFVLCIGLSNSITSEFNLSHHPSGFKNQLQSMMHEGLFCLIVSRHPRWSYIISYSNVRTQWHQESARLMQRSHINMRVRTSCSTAGTQGRVWT